VFDKGDPYPSNFIRVLHDLFPAPELQIWQRPCSDSTVSETASFQSMARQDFHVAPDNQTTIVGSGAITGENPNQP
jgi:hypothetical protein